MSRFERVVYQQHAIHDYADATGSLSGSSGRRCQRCHARLRRGQPMSVTHCDPCTTILHPWQPPILDEPQRECEWCERAYTPDHSQQRYCSPTCRACARRARDVVRKRRVA